MTPKVQRQALLAAGLVAIVAGVFYMNSDPEPPAAAGVAPSTTASTARGARGIPVADVKLELLKGDRGEMDAAERNPFRFQARVAPPSSGGGARRVSAPPPPPVLTGPPVPAGPPPLPPIPLRFIGLVEAPAQAGRVAILSDGRGNVFYGKEGDIIEGRYRLLRIGPDAAEFAYTDGRGRQTVRLAGQ